MRFPVLTFVFILFGIFNAFSQLEIKKYKVDRFLERIQVLSHSIIPSDKELILVFSDTISSFGETKSNQLIINKRRLENHSKAMYQVYFIVAHEFSHCIANHNSMTSIERKNLEAAADFYAGVLLGKYNNNYYRERLDRKEIQPHISKLLRLDGKNAVEYFQPEDRFCCFWEGFKYSSQINNGKEFSICFNNFRYDHRHNLFPSEKN